MRPTLDPPAPPLPSSQLARALWSVDPDCCLAGECRWGRAGALLRSGVLPASAEVATAAGATLGRFLDKAGGVTPFALPPGGPAVGFLRQLLAGEALGELPPQAAPQFVQRHLEVAGGAGWPDARAAMPAPGGPLPVGGQAMQVSLCPRVLQRLCALSRTLACVACGRHVCALSRTLACIACGRHAARSRACAEAAYLPPASRLVAHLATCQPAT